MRWALLIELALYAWLVEWPAAVALFLGIRAALVAMSYGFVFTTPERGQASAAQWLRMALEVWLGLILLFVIVQPFERFWMGADRLRPGERLPLLLLHGYQCNRGFWFWMRPQLEAAGWVVATHNLEPDCTSIDNYAAGVGKRIDEVLAATGAQQVIVVAHSMGGLVARAYLRACGERRGRVARVVTLGSPHYGSRMAILGWGENGRQMRIGNPWLRELASVALPPGSCSIYSRHDNQVMPQAACSALTNARNVEIDGVTHLGMAFSPLVLKQLLEELRSDIPDVIPA
jgi:triacylglycerol lipase